MFNTKTYVNAEEVHEDITADMLMMTGWEDTEETTFGVIKNGVCEKLDDYRLVGKHAVYLGDEVVTIAITHMRNLIIALSTKDLTDVKGDKVDYLIREFYFSRTGFERCCWLASDKAR